MGAFLYFCVYVVVVVVFFGNFVKKMGLFDKNTRKKTLHAPLGPVCDRDVVGGAINLRNDLE